MTQDQVLNLIFLALKQLKDNRINDVSEENAGYQIILTTDDGNDTDIWIIDEEGNHEFSSDE